MLNVFFFKFYIIVEQTKRDLYPLLLEPHISRKQIYTLAVLSPGISCHYEMYASGLFHTVYPYIWRVEGLR